MKGRVILILILSAGLVPFIHSQIQSVNIGGSYSETFMLSGSGEADYQVAGSPYLSETWMFGSLEMKTDLISSRSQDRKTKAQMHQYKVMIRKIDALIGKLSDPEYVANGLSLDMEGVDGSGGQAEYDVTISISDFPDFDRVTGEVEEKLLTYLLQLKADYEAEINEFFKISGLFRYNLYAQEFEMIHNVDTFAITAPFNVKSISISNMNFIHGLYVERGRGRTQLGSAYFQTLNEGACKLLMRHHVKIKGGGGPVTYNWAGGADSFVKYQQLYYQESDGSEAVPVKKRKRLLLKLFSDKSEQVERFIRSEHINIKETAGLVRVFDYYNSLDT